MNYWKIRKAADSMRKVPLDAVLRAHGARLDPKDKTKWLSQAGSIVVTDTKFMNFSHAVGGGGAIDLAMHLRGVPFTEAVAWLMDQFPNTLDVNETKRPRSSRTNFILPKYDEQNISRVIQYLTLQRGLPMRLLEHLIQTERLYADGRANAVFVLRGKENMPVGAELRGTTEISWRGLAVNSKKDLGYFCLRARDANELVLVESAIDAISYFTLNRSRTCISTTGARPHPKWLASLVSKGLQIYCGYDSDATGETMAQAMSKTYPTIRRIRPEKKDWNDVLLSKK